MSRPFKEVKRSEVIRFKLTKEEKETLTKEARKRGLCTSQFIRIAISNEIYDTNINRDYDARLTDPEDYYEGGYND